MMLVKNKGPGWSLYTYDKPYLILHNFKSGWTRFIYQNTRKYNYPKCGLPNIKHDDDECFKYCTTYHQTKQENHDDRLTVVSNFNNTYK